MNVASILDIKGRDVATVRAGSSLMEITGNLAEHKVGALIVVDDAGHVEGIISERDVVRAISTGGAGVLDQAAGQHMTSDVVTCGLDDTVGELMERMTTGRFRHLPVIDGGKLIGIVSIGDVVKQRIAEAEQEAEAMRTYIASG